jgi:beta-lactamase class A
MKPGLGIMLALLGFFSWGAESVGAAAPPLPLNVSPAHWRPLEQRLDRGLQLRLEKALKQNELWKSLIAEGKLAVGVVDLSDPQAPRFARVNGDTLFYAASLPKIAILLAAHWCFENGTLRETPQINADLMDMIRRSDNPAASRITNLIGLDRIAAVILLPRHRFYEVKQGGGIWVGSGFGGEREQFPEPLKGGLHTATVNQVCRFYYLLAYGRLLNPRRSQQMLNILSRPALNDKFVSALGKSVPLDRVYRKNGIFGTWHSDSMLVWGEDWRRYILVGLVENEQGEQILRDLVPVAERLLRPTSSAK